MNARRLDVFLSSANIQKRIDIDLNIDLSNTSHYMVGLLSRKLLASISTVCAIADEIEVLD